MKKTILVLALTFFSCNQIFAQNSLNLRMVPSNGALKTKIDRYTYESPTQTRTIRDFNYKKDAIAVSDKWALSNNFVTVSASTKNTRIYKKGRGILSAPTICEIKQNGERVHIEAYVKTSKLWDKLSRHHLPAEMKVTPGGLKLISSRETGRYFVNKLLIDLGQKDILINDVLINPKVDSL